MPMKQVITGLLLLVLFVAGCSNQNGTDNSSNSISDETGPARDDNIPNHGGPAITGVDSSNPTLDRGSQQNKLNNRKHKSHQTTIRVSDAAANKAADLPDVNRAVVIVVDNNAYVAAVLDRSSPNFQTNGIENSITRTIKQVDKNVNNVYITSSPKFYRSFQGFARKIRSNSPSSDYYNDLTDTIRQAFPDVK
ncbi:YhcN/YlaJ family sporulation lipoprotein [Neobacillus dielmonensis]|uniref:YhcN/YlaJ family sporulation lipoprotein n=1 Tax=Neobacillus dielmonensis TaxID=1347369 RepID=UPI0005A60F60|nr:YhcN/YlaJ family sporulation lipoprotein [Neobacillus dielmonensis]